jgi:DNA-binding GntR family transcriptional regulator
VHLSEKAYHRLRAMILGNRFSPDNILSERELAARLAMSRVPVREAVKYLQREGLLLVVPRSGIHLRRLTPQEVSDLYEVRQAIEGMAAFLCAGRAGAKEKHAMCRRLERLAARRGKPDHAAIQRESSIFHRTLFALCGNGELAAVYASIEPKIDLNLRMTALHAPSRIEQALVEHIEIANAIKAGSSQKAERLMRAHLENGKLARIAILDDWQANSATSAPSNKRAQTRCSRYGRAGHKPLRARKTWLRNSPSKKNRTREVFA